MCTHVSICVYTYIHILSSFIGIHVCLRVYIYTYCLSVFMYTDNRQYVHTLLPE